MYVPAHLPVALGSTAVDNENPVDKLFLIPPSNISLPRDPFVFNYAARFIRSTRVITFSPVDNTRHLDVSRAPGRGGRSFSPERTVD